jgi:hypothetical protein
LRRMREQLPARGRVLIFDMVMPEDSLSFTHDEPHAVVHNLAVCAATKRPSAQPRQRRSSGF